ncbi:MAG: dihydroneopterin aldolase [Cytophagales bacterium]|nr:dihydroneopterin aldolase [Bernardetiaceae bacterium]MDW8210471.1 dihydroneopterin aldolase [Cytophagales bacterium]
MHNDTVALKGLMFFARHGYYEEERKIGNRYGVDIQVKADLRRAANHDSLKDTINYETLYDIAKTEMEKPARLLEHLAERIIKQIFNHFPAAEQVKVVVRKYNPPVGGVCRAAEIILCRTRQEYEQVLS